MAKSMLETSQGPAKRDLPYLQWVIVCKGCYWTLQSMGKSMRVTPKVRRKRICYVKPVRKVLSACSYEIPNWIWNGSRGVLCRRPVGGNRSWTQRRVTVAVPESGTAGTKTWRWRLSLSRWQLSQEAGVYQLVSVSTRRVTSSKAGRRRELNPSCLTPRQQHRENQDFEVTIEPWNTIESRRPWWAVSDCKVYKDLCKPGCIDYLCRLGMYHLCKPVDNHKDWILTSVFLAEISYLAGLWLVSFQLVDIGNPAQVMTGVFPIGRYDNPSQNLLIGPWWWQGSSYSWCLSSQVGCR